MRVFVHKQFDRWAEKEGIDDATLTEAALEAFNGGYEADLGGYLFKKRVARKNDGKSGGYRTILCFKKADEDRVFFLHGFGKNKKSNILKSEEKALKLLAESLVKLSDTQINELKSKKTIREIERGTTNADAPEE